MPRDGYALADKHKGKALVCGVNLRVGSGNAHHGEQVSHIDQVEFYADMIAHLIEGMGVRDGMGMSAGFLDGGLDGCIDLHRVLPTIIHWRPYTLLNIRVISCVAGVPNISALVITAVVGAFCTTNKLHNIFD